MTYELLAAVAVFVAGFCAVAVQFLLDGDWQWPG